MQLTRRGFIERGAAVLSAGGTGLLAACQGAPAPAPTNAAAGTTQQTATTKPAIQPAASVAPVTVAPASQPAAQAAPSPSPAVAAAASPSPATRAPTAAGKPMYQQDAQHTGRSPYAGPRQASVLRRFDTALPQNMPSDPAIPRSDFQSTSAVGPDGTIYIANFPGVLFALRDSPAARDQLELVWRFHPPIATALHATPALSSDGSTVYLPFSTGGANTPSKGTMYALKAPATGTEPQLLWTVDLGASRTSGSPTVGPDGAVYVVSSAGQLFAIGSDGGVKWTAQTGPTTKSAPALAPDGTLYHATLDGKMYALSPQGQVKWTFDFGAHLGPTPLLTAEVGGPSGAGALGIGSGASPTVGPDGSVYIGANNSNMYAVAPDGRMKWLFEAQRELAGIWTTPCLSADGGTLFFGANKGGVYALNAQDGTRRWQFNVYGSIYASSVLDARGVLYTASSIEHVYALDTSKGELVWDFDAKNQVWTAPSIRPDGTLAIADRAGLVMVLG